MQPKENQANYGQLSLDLGIDEQNSINHPFDFTFSLEKLKEDLEPISHSMLLGTPVLCSEPSIITWDKTKGSVWDDGIDQNIKDIALIYNEVKHLATFNSENLEQLRASNNHLRYVINYFYNDPKETTNDKIEIIKNLTEFRHPKKWVYDTILETEKTMELEPQELATCVYHRAYITINDYWELVFKPNFRKVFTKEGLKELKKVYNNIKANSGTYLTRSIEEDVLKELTNNAQEYYNNPSLKNYIDFLKARLNKIKIIYDNGLTAYNNYLHETKEYLKAYNTTIDQVKEQIAIKLNKPYNEIILRDRELFKYYLAKINLEEDLKRDLTDEELVELSLSKGYKINNEEYNYISSIIKAKIGTLESFYYKLLHLARYEEINNFRRASIDINEDLIERASKLNSREYKINALIEHLLQPQYFYRNDRESALIEIAAKGEIAQQDNSTTDAIKYYGINTHKATKKALEEFNKALKRKTEIDPDINNLAAKIRELTILGAEEQEIKNYNDKLNALLSELEELESILKTFYIYKPGTNEEKILELRLTGTDLKGAQIVRDNNYIGYKTKDLKIVYPYSFKVDTQRLGALGLTDTTLEYDTLNYMTKTKEELLQAYFTLILAKIPHDRNAFYFDYDELCESLKLPKNKDGYTTIRELSALMGEIKISGSYSINKAKNIKKPLELTRIGIFRNDSPGKKIYITLESVYYAIFKNNTSYITPNLVQRNHLSLTGANYYDYIVKTYKQVEHYNKPHIIQLSTFRDMNPNANKWASKTHFYETNISPVYDDLKDIGIYTDYEIEDLPELLKINNEDQLQAKRLKVNRKIK